MDSVPPLPSELTDEQHARILTPAFLRRTHAKAIDPVLADKSERIAVLREDNQPISLAELEAARNRALRQMVRRLYEMKPQEVISAVEVLDGEIAARRVATGEGVQETKATREEMLKALRGTTQEVQE